MRLYIIGSSALHFWRRCKLLQVILSALVSSPLVDTPASRAELQAIEVPMGLFGGGPIHLMVGSDKGRFSRDQFWYSVCSRPLPSTCFRQVTDSICVASPELCLLESASTLSLCQLMELCMEMCGMYSLVPESPRGYLTRECALCTPDSIREFLAAMKGMPGSEKLSTAIRFIEGASRSPMETRAFLLACLPKRLGSYGIPRAQLNYRIELSAEERAYSKRRYLECDMFWPGQRLAVEYDGHDDHASREDRANDALKRNVLLARGITVFTITGRQICDPSSFDQTMRDISKMLGYRLKDFPGNWAERRGNLRSELFKSMASYEQERFF